MATRRKHNKQRKTRKMRRGGFWPFTSSTASATTIVPEPAQPSGESWWTRLWKPKTPTSTSGSTTEPAAASEISAQAAPAAGDAPVTDMKLMGGKKRKCKRSCKK